MSSFVDVCNTRLIHAVPSFLIEHVRVDSDSCVPDVAIGEVVESRCSDSPVSLPVISDRRQNILP